MKILSVFLMSCLLASPAFAAQSSYSKYNLDTDCKFEVPADEEMAGMGAAAICAKDGKPNMYFLEGDLRHSVGFGALQRFESFGVWNNIGSTVEWRSDNSGIYAAILRFYTSNFNNDTGEFDSGNQGQILLVHKVANSPQDESCVVGMVDARANKDANILARQVADEQAKSFDCARDIPQYFGGRGEHAATFMTNKPIPATAN